MDLKPNILEAEDRNLWILFASYLYTLTSFAKMPKFRLYYMQSERQPNAN